MSAVSCAYDYFPSVLSIIFNILLERWGITCSCSWWCHPCFYSAPAKTQCQEEAAAAKHKLGAHKPQCDEQGQYTPMQCWHAVGLCWCVDSTGKPIEGTSMRGRPECSKGETWRPWPFLPTAIVVKRYNRHSLCVLQQPLLAEWWSPPWGSWPHWTSEMSEYLRLNWAHSRGTWTELMVLYSQAFIHMGFINISLFLFQISETLEGSWSAFLLTLESLQLWKADVFYHAKLYI